MLYEVITVMLFESSLKNRHNTISVKERIKQGEYLVKVTTATTSQTLKVIIGN